MYTILVTDDNELKVTTGQLNSGNTKSCGCARKERMKKEDAFIQMCFE